MARRILKSTISVMEAFNDVRNEQSFAHDNRVLGREESLLIVNRVVSLVAYLRSVDKPSNAISSTPADTDEDFPF